MKVLKGNEEVVITGKELAKHRDICRREGALEELEKLLGRLKIGGFIDKEHLWEMIENRIKELEKEGVEA